ncbi:uncharacterized protein [Clytia hemisphaerica]|uniref:uncharacterized protein n=1 Tax=Clytia hemisphaerica TaxID=252671 RepID=UPI0034D6C10F|eukprot:TCONS_00010604-protein
MSSVHSGERNLAHCAATATSHPQQAANHDVTKLKGEYERQIQTLKLEHKIQLLELDNKMSKQENDNKTKMLELQKENQSLKHENELMKVKSAHELQSNKLLVDSNLERQMAAKELEFRDLVKVKDEEIALKDKEMMIGMAEKEKEIIEKDKEFLKQENMHKIEMIKMKNEMEKTIESLRNEIEMQKKKVEERPKEMGNPNEIVVNPFELPLMEQLEWGTNIISNEKYQEWYKHIINAMENKKLYKNERFLYMRKIFGCFKNDLFFVNLHSGKARVENDTDFQAEGLDTHALNKGTFVLLHPKDAWQSLRTQRSGRTGFYDYWKFLIFWPFSSWTFL